MEQHAREQSLGPKAGIYSLIYSGGNPFLGTTPCHFLG